LEYYLYLYILLLSIVCFVSFCCFENNVAVNSHVKANSLLCHVVVLCLLGHHVGLGFTSIYLFLSFNT